MPHRHAAAHERGLHLDGCVGSFVGGWMGSGKWTRPFAHRLIEPHNQHLPCLNRPAAGFDYRGEPTPYAWPSVSSHFGVIDIGGMAKDLFYYYQSVWTSKRVVRLVPHHWDWCVSPLLANLSLRCPYLTPFPLRLLTYPKKHT